MKIGIVGAEAAKFTAGTATMAKIIIACMLKPDDIVISGQCPLGGIDIWAVEIARDMGLKAIEYPPKEHNWTYGYKPRNLQIARECDKLVCIAVKRLPKTFMGRRFPYCYHCKQEGHIKSGGCWTMKEAAKLGKETQLIVV